VPFSYQRDDRADGPVLKISGNLDITTAPQLAEPFEALIEQRPGKVEVDLSNLDLIDSSGVACLVGLYKRVRSSGGQMGVVGARDQPLAIFKLLRMDKVFLL